MKKIFYILPMLVLLASCANKEAKSSSQKSNGKVSVNKTSNSTPVNKVGPVSYNEMQAFFEPDFSVLPAENIRENGTAAKTEETKKSKAKSENIIPGLRKLSEYKTSYSTSKSHWAKKTVPTENISEEAADTEFYVSEWGPYEIVSESENPSLYVVFSQPVHKLSALEEPTDKSDIMTITPALKGKFRWYGTKHLAFEAEEPGDPCQNYKIEINPNLKSLSKSKLTGETTFYTKAEEIKIIRLFGGYLKDSDYYSNYSTGTIPPYDKRFYLRVNYPITVERLNEILEVSCNGKNLTYDAVIDYNEKAFNWSSPVKYDKLSRKSNSFVVTIKDPVEFNTKVIVSLAGMNSSNSYSTLKPFYINEVHSYTSYSENDRLNPLEVRFSQIPDLQSLIENTVFDFDVKLSEKNVAVENYTAKFFNLPISKREEHVISFKKGIKDIYGQDLDFRVRKYGNITDNVKTSFNFKVSSPTAYSKFLNWGVNIMEAQFPHKIIFEYQNIKKGSEYFISAVKDPLLYKELSKQKENAIIIEPGKLDQRHFMEIELDPYLENGYGAIEFEANILRDYYDSWSDQWEETTDSNVQQIQVTDLGVTARVGINKAVILVRSMKTGKPVEKAQVQIFGQNSYTRGDIESTPFAKGTTDKNGLCIIKFTEQEYNAFKKHFENLYNRAPAVKVTKDNDSVIFYPTSHNAYRDGVWTESYERASSSKQRTFMFVDRGLYKPGETVTFRGIDRDQTLGMIRTHQGNYTLKLTDGSWDSNTSIVPIPGGTLSESGGFYGSFTLPEDIEPGTYCIVYERADEKYATKYCYFTVAEFERLKIQSAITTPQITYFGGDKLSAELSADYLAGGALANATYTVNWYKQSVDFTPATNETKGFSFGPLNHYDSRTYYSDDKGSLNSEGKANLMCNTEKITDGSAYSYRVEAAVTDVSNQRISSANTILVHPAQFYVGLKRSHGGFAKKGTKIDIDYLLVNPDGTLLSTTTKAKELNYKLTRRVWTMVHEQSVDNTVYTRYESSEKEEASGNVKITASGTFSVTPPEAGWYTLTVSGTDSKNNYVETVLQFYASGSSAAYRGSSSSESINLTPSQSLYNPGDKAQILMESPLPAGDYLITVEREGIFTEELKHFDSPAEVIEIPVSENYVPVVYVSVSTYSVRTSEPTHQYGEPDLDKPKGYYGVTAINVNPMVKAFSVEIECDKPVYRPGETATITLTATKGGEPYKNAEITLMAVDRGVLDLINYHVSNPIDYFYDVENFHLGVWGGDSRAYLMDPVTYSVKNLQGGDAEEDEEKEDERKDFRPTALFEPALITDDKGQVRCTFTLPDNLTTYRITAFGVKDDIFALQEDEVKVQNPMNVQIVTPRKLRERDTAEFGVLITNLDKDAQKVTVSATVEPLTEELAAAIKYNYEEGMKVAGGEAFIDGKTEHTVTVQSGDSSVVYFDLAAVKQGTVAITFHVNSSILKEKIISTLDIQKTFTYETVTMIGTADDSNPKIKEEFIIPGFAKEGQGQLSFTLDATRLGLLGGGVNYLFRYPYGCLEQQSSKVLPLVIFENYIDVFGLDSEVNHPKSVVKAYMKKWGKYQLNDGSFPYWPDSSYPSFYVSLRIAHIYATALSHGYKASELKIDINKLLAYLTAETSKIESKQTLAYAAYVLSKFDDSTAKAASRRILEKLQAEKETETLMNLAYMGIAYNNNGEKAKAQELADFIRRYLEPSERSVSIAKKYKRNIWDCFESESQQLSAILQLFVTMNPQDQMVDRLIFTLMQQQSGGYWKNTASTAHVLEGIYTYIKARNLDDTDYTALVSIKDNQVMTEKFKGAGAKPKTLTLGFTEAQLSSLPRDASIPVTFEKSGKGQLYYTMEMKYALPDEMLTARNEGLKLSYDITDFETGEIVNTPNPDNCVVALESGKLYKATIRLESVRDRTYVALRVPVPSGAEILDSTFVTSGTEAEIISDADWRHWISNKVIYDNEIQFFWDSFGTGSTTLTFTFRGARRGVYPTPPVTAQCMYEEEIFGRSEGYLFTIQ